MYVILFLGPRRRKWVLIYSFVPITARTAVIHSGPYPITQKVSQPKKVKQLGLFALRSRWSRWLCEYKADIAWICSWPQCNQHFLSVHTVSISSCSLFFRPTVRQLGSAKEAIEAYQQDVANIPEGAWHGCFQACFPKVQYNQIPLGLCYYYRGVKTDSSLQFHLKYLQ